MQEQLLAIFEPLKTLNPIIYVLVIAFVPLIELRGSIPVAIAALGFSAWEAFFWSVVGSILPALIVIPCFNWFLEWLDKNHFLPWLTNWLNKKFSDKVSKVAAQQEAIETSNSPAWRRELIKFWSIAIFVGIPLPGTGVWTGSAIASIIKMPFKKAFGAVLVGDIIAGIIVTIVTLVVKAGWGAIF